MTESSRTTSLGNPVKTRDPGRWGQGRVFAAVGLALGWRLAWALPAPALGTYLRQLGVCPEHDQLPSLMRSLPSSPRNSSSAAWTGGVSMELRLGLRARTTLGLRW